MEERIKGEQAAWYNTRSIFLVPVILLLAVSLLFYYQPQERLVQVLRDRYQQITEIDYDQYLPQNMEGNSIPFIIPNIIPIDHPQASPMGMTVIELLHTIKAGTKLAITGRPGVGKSTLARHIIILWAQGKALPQFNVLFHICLGRVTTNITGLQSLVEEECHGLVTDNPELDVTKLVKGIQDTDGDRVAFVLDALDEYHPGPHLKNDHVFKLIKNISLPKSAIIVTSRSRRIDDIRKYFTERVEVEGFNETDIDISLLRLGPPLGPVIAQYLDQSPNVKKMCYLPLHMTMIIYLASLKVESLSLIDTETKIYSSFLYLTIENYYTRRHQWNRLSLCFETPHPQNDLCDLFAKVCELAFNATVDQQQTFTSREIERLLLPSDTLEALSLFKIEKENRRQGSIDVYYFSHQTFQEFMTAYHLLILPENEQNKIISRHVGKKNIFSDLIWKFFFGLVGENRNEKTLFNLFNAFVSNSGYKQLDSYYYVIDLYPLIYAYETGKRNETFASILSKSNITGPGNNYSLHIQIDETMDLRSVLAFGEMTNFIFLTYALRWIPIVSIKLELQVRTTHPDPRLCTDEYRAIAANRMPELFSAYCSSKVNVSNDVILELVYFRKQHNLDPQLLVRTLSSLQVDQLQASALRLELVRYIANKKADSTQITPSLIVDIITSRTHNFSDNILTEEELQYIKLGYPLQKYKQDFYSSSLEMMNFVGLKKFKLQNSLSDYDLIPICEALKSATSLETLDLSNNFLTNLTGLLVFLPSLKQLKNLDLSGNFLHAKDIERFATGFKYLTHLNKLDLSGNWILDSTFDAFSKNLIHLKQLRELDLSQTYCDDQKLASGLSHLTELRKLSMSHCLISTKHLKELTKSFKHLSNLEELDLSYNLIDVLSNRDLLPLQTREINLSNNFINQPLIEIFSAILAFPISNLRKLDLSNNFLCADEEELRAFIHMFALFSEVREVDLSYNMIFLGDSELRRKSLRIRFDTQCHTKEIKLKGSEYLADRADQSFATCVCEQAGSYSEGLVKLFTDLYCYGGTPKSEGIRDYVLGNYSRKQKAYKEKYWDYYSEKRTKKMQTINSISKSQSKALVSLRKSPKMFIIDEETGEARPY